MLSNKKKIDKYSSRQKWKFISALYFRTIQGTIFQRPTQQETIWSLVNKLESLSHSMPWKCFIEVNKYVVRGKYIILYIQDFC